MPTAISPDFNSRRPGTELFDPMLGGLGRCASEQQSRQPFLHLQGFRREGIALAYLALGESGFEPAHPLR